MTDEQPIFPDEQSTLREEQPTLPEDGVEDLAPKDEGEQIAGGGDHLFGGKAGELKSA
jgi:hypothetical protein